jgi:hypothetical protein
MKKEKRGKEPNKGVGVVGPTPTKAIFAGGQIIQIWPQSVPLLLLFPFQLTHTTKLSPPQRDKLSTPLASLGNNELIKTQSDL